MSTALEETKKKVKQTKLSVLELAQKLSQGEVLELKASAELSITDIDAGDFLSLVNEEDHPKKLNILQQVMNRYNLNLQLQGSIALGVMNLDDRSWTVAAGDAESLKVSARPMPLRRSVNDLVAFLKKLPLGQALVLKTQQDLLLEGFSQEAVVNYYEFSQNTQDAKILETSQDQFFIQSSALLREEGLCLKIFAVEASLMNREVNPMLGQILFRAQGNETLTQPKLLAVLVKQA